MKLERYASAQDAARAAAEAAQIIRRNEAQNIVERARHAHALAELERFTSLEPWAKAEATEPSQYESVGGSSLGWTEEPEQVAAE